MKQLHLFDFDGTVTTGDSSFEIIKYHNGSLSLLLGLLLHSPLIALTLAGLFPRQKLKESFLKFFFGGKKKDELEDLGRSFVHDHLPRIIRKEALELIFKLKNEDQEVAMVSASMDFWLEPFADQYGISLICSQAEYENDIFTGKLMGKNCRGMEKVNRIKDRYDLERYSEVHAYGDSNADRPMLNIAEYEHWKPFRN